MTIKAKLLRRFYNLIAQRFFCVEELKNTRTGGYGKKIDWKGQERNNPEKKTSRRLEMSKN